jgi:hypothetical protein
METVGKYIGLNSKKSRENIYTVRLALWMETVGKYIKLSLELNTVGKYVKLSLELETVGKWL